MTAPPVVKNQTVTIVIDDLSVNGEGIGRHDGYTLFVNSALPGETVEVRVTKIGRDYGYAKLINILDASPERREPDCPLQNSCGGCGLRHLNYESQLKYKTGRVADALSRIAGERDLIVRGCVGMDSPYYYRNKAQFPAGIIDGGPAFGFYARRSHRLTPVVGCLINDPVNDIIIAKTLEYMAENGVSAYDEASHSGTVRHLVTRVGKKSGEIIVCLCINKKYLPYSGALIEKLTTIPGVVGVAASINTKKTNVIMGGKTEFIWGKKYISDSLIGTEFQISPSSFYQVNPVQTEIVYKTAINFSDPKPGDTVVDAYCGIGTIALCIAGRVKKVYGIESSAEAVSDARANAKLNGVTNAEFIHGMAEHALEELYSSGVSPDILIADPARRGCDIKLLETIGKHRPGRMVYISCDPASFARDVKILRGYGYKLTEVQPVDCFAFSPHVETVALLSC